jgi:hypothetical protein
VALCQARTSTKPLWGLSSSNPYHPSHVPNNCETTFAFQTFFPCLGVTPLSIWHGDLGFVPQGEDFKLYVFQSGDINANACRLSK